MLSPTLPQQHRNAGANPLSTCRYTIRHLIIDLASGKTRLKQPRRRRLADWSMFDSDDEDGEPTLLPYQEARPPVALLPPSGRENARYVWNGPTTLWNASRAADGSADRLGFYPASMLWSLLDFKWLSRGFGLIVYEGILDTVEFRVDGKARPRYDLNRLIRRLPGSEHCRTKTMKALMRWKAWAAEWRSRGRAGVNFTAPRPASPFVRYPGHWEWILEQLFFENYRNRYR